MKELGYEYITAHFTNNERTTCEIIWRDANEKSETYDQVFAAICEASDDDAQWKELLTIVDIDQIHENTYKFIKEQDEILQKSIMGVARERGMLYDVDSVNSELYKSLAEIIFKAFDEEVDKEKLFMLKLQLFELPVIKNSKNRAEKAALRKAQTMMTAIKHGIIIAEEAAELGAAENVDQEEKASE